VPRRGRGYERDRKTGEWQNARDENVSYKYAGGGVISTDEDLLRFAIALNAGKLLSAKSMAEMYRLQLPADIPYAPEDVKDFKEGKARPSMGLTQALIWRMQKDSAGRVYASHSGAVKGTGSMLSNWKDQGVVVALHMNGSGGKIGVTAAAEELAQLFLPAGQVSQARFDVLIQGGTVVDGTGKQRFKADIGISGDKNVAVGNLAGATETRAIDAALQKEGNPH
jgi:serine beta-lactamase-like protein LACTB